jgi:polysaccharide pyruvyl transferase WcaK-like protein
MTQCFCTLLLRKNLIILAQTFGPFQRRWSRALAKFYMKHASLVTARDHRSYEELVALVGQRDHIKETRDLAFLLKPTDWETVAARHSELTKLPPQFAAVSVSRTFAVNVLRTNESIRSDPERFRSAMAQCLDEFVSATRIPLVFVPQVVVGASGDDRREAAEVQKRMTHRDSAFVCAGEYTAGELKAVIGQAHMAVACRMHAQVAAVSQGVPVLALAYSPKSLDVIGKALKYEYVLDARVIEPDDFAKQASVMMVKMAARRELIERTLLEIMPKILEQSQTNIDLLVSACSSEPNTSGGSLEEL